MRCSTAWSALSATTPVCSLFFLLRALDVRMCRANACCRTTFPVPVFLNRLDAPLWVLSLGMKIFREPKFYHKSFPACPARSLEYAVPSELSAPDPGGTIKSEMQSSSGEAGEAVTVGQFALVAYIPDPLA